MSAMLQTRFTHLYRQSISYILSSILLGNAVYAGDIIADTTAAQKYQATMDTTANGIPLINIVTPNSSGLSHNKFSDFNINPSGLILNNATRAVQTQLGGYVQGNSNLGTTHASVILNEVTGTNRTLLRGYGEVAGYAADVIVANPNGITLNGGGFINTPHATLTTGTPEFSGNALSGFHVQGGDILIEGSGLNASNIDRVDLYTKALVLNAQLHAKTLDVITGENTITRDGTVTSDNVTGNGGFSIDSSALGGIYANTIRLVGTDKGVGINLPAITYASNSLELNADGKIIIGTALAENALNATSHSDSITLKEKIWSNQASLIAKTAIDNEAEVSVTTNVSFTANDVNNHIGASIEADNIQTSVANTLTNEGSLTGRILDISAQKVLNSDSIQGSLIKINAVDALNNSGIISGNKNLHATSKSIVNNTSGVITSEKLTLNTSDDIINHGEVSGRDVTITAKNLSNTDSITAETMDMALVNALENDGTVSTLEHLKIGASAITNNGLLFSGYDMALSAKDLTNTGGIASVNASGLPTVMSVEADNLYNYNTLYSGGSIHLYVQDTLLNQTDQSEATIYANNDIFIQGNRDKTLRTAHIINDKGLIETAVGDISIYATTFQNLADPTTKESRPVTTSTITLYPSDSSKFYDLRTYAFAGKGGRTSHYSLSYLTQAQAEVKNDLIQAGETKTYTGEKNLAGDFTINGVSYDSSEVLSITEIPNTSNQSYNPRNIQKPKYEVTYIDKSEITPDKILIKLNDHYGQYGLTVKYTPSPFPNISLFNTGSPYYIELPKKNEEVQRYYKTTISEESFISAPTRSAKLISGGNITIDADTRNYLSLISAAGNINFKGSINNQGETLNRFRSTTGEYYYCYKECDSFWHDPDYTWAPLEPIYSSEIIGNLFSTIQAGGSISGDITSLTNDGGVSTNGTYTTYTPINTFKDTTATAYTSDNVEITPPTNPYGLFITADPTHPYLIESNPLYTNYNTFIGSDYIMSRLNLNMAADTKRLGDAMYETQLVRDAVFRLTGERYLAGFGSDTDEYKALMDNALALQSDLNLQLGVSLSAAQVSALNKDIVWMEDRVVSGQHVLVPVVYLASLKNQELTSGGKIIAGDSINLAASGDVSNSGTIKVNTQLIIEANTLTNSSGILSSDGTTFLSATGDIINKNGGHISGNEVGILSREGSVTNETFTQTTTEGSANRNITYTLIGDKSTIQATEGNLIVQAKNDIKNLGADMSAGQSIVLTAQEGNIDFKTETLESGHNEIRGGSFDKAKDVEQLSSSANAGEHIIIQSGGDINLEASRLAAGGTVVLEADENVNLSALNDVTYRDVQTHSKGSFGSSKTTRDMSYKESTVGSEIDAANIVISSGKDATLQAANLKAQENIQVNAAGDINVIAKEYREGELHYTKKSSFGGLVSSASLDSTEAVKLHEATLKTEAKNIIMNSGKDINIIASEVTSAADVALTAFENLNIVAGEESKSEKHVSEKTSFNLVNFATGIATLGLVDTGAIYTNEVHNKGNYDTTAKSSSIKAGGNIVADTGTTNIIGSNLSAGDNVAIKADIGGINIASAQELHNASQLDKKTEVKLGDIVTSVTEGVKGLGEDTKLKLNVASATFDESTTTAQGVTNVGSSITSGKNVTLDSSDDIAIKGSDVTAKDTLTLKSKTGNIAITESVDTTNTVSKEKHASAEVNLVVQNEFVETGVAVKNAVEAAEQLKQTKEDYSNYKRQLKGLETSLDTLKKDPQVSENDISNLQALIAATKDDEAYYIAAIAAATVNLASKTVAIAQQANAAGASTETLGFSAGLSLDMKGSKTSTDTTATKSNASNLTASNINIATDNTKDTSVTVSGSNINAADTLNISTHDLNVIASKDTATTNSSSKDISGSVSMTVYGAASGPQVSLGYGQNESRSNSTTYTNSTLSGNTLNLNATNDATFKGATVHADDTLNVNVGNNLEVASVQDTSSSSNHGMNISGGFGLGSDPADTSSNPNEAARKVEQGKLNQTVGVRTGDGTIASVNGGVGVSNGRSFDTQTVVTSLTGDSVNVTTGANTKLSGSVIAATDAQGNDTGKLGLTTQTLTTENLTDTHYNSATGFSVGANIGLTPATKDPKPDTKSTETPSGTKINSEHIAFNTSTDTSVGKTLATVGEGTITITDPRHSVLDTESKENLNRDVTKVDKELYSSSTGTQVDATIDNRMFTEDGQKEIKNQTKELAGNVINTTAFVGNVITGNMDVDNAIASFQDPLKMAEAIKANPELAASLDAFTKGEFDNLPKTKEGLQALADATGLKVDVLLTTVTNYEDAKGTTDKKLVALDVNPDNRADIVGTLGHEENHARGGTNETLADMSGYAAQLLSEVAIDSHDPATLEAIKANLGTGTDDATQLLNQAMLINDNLKLIQALDDHPEEFDYKRDTNPQLNVAYGTNSQPNTKITSIINALLDFTPILGDAKGFAEAQTKGDYFFAMLGVVPVAGDGAKTAYKTYQEAKKAGDVKGMQNAIDMAKNQVGEYKTLKKNDIVGDGLDNHHVMQSDYGKNNITGYDPKTAPSIKLDEETHRLISAEQKRNQVARSQMTPRELLADDVRMLRDHNVPNSQIQQIIQMNKDKYGFVKSTTGG